MVAYSDYVPRDDVKTLPPDKKKIFDRGAKEYSDQVQKMRFLAFLVSEDWNEDVAHEKMEDIIELEEKTVVPSNESMRPYYTKKDGLTPPCVVLLEGKDGSCARAKDGSPIVVGYGVLEGSDQQIIDQLNFVFYRCSLHVKDTEMPKVYFVNDILPRKDLHSEQPPNWTVGAHLQKFPITSFCYNCGVQDWMIALDEKAQPLIPEKVKSTYKMSKDYACLKEMATEENLLPEWGGTFEFDLESYVDYILPAEELRK